MGYFCDTIVIFFRRFIKGNGTQIMKILKLLPFFLLVGCSSPEPISIFDLHENSAKRFNEEGYKLARIAVENTFDSKISTLEFGDIPKTKTLRYKMSYQDNICTVDIDNSDPSNMRIKKIDCIQVKDDLNPFLDKTLTELGKKVYLHQLKQYKEELSKKIPTEVPPEKP